MIFVTVGSSAIPFDRLLRAVDGVSVDERLIVQHGASAIRPRGAESVDFLDYDGFVGYVRAARVIVTHAGVGSIITALGEGKRPVVVPRLAAHGEAVDDHQVPFARAGELGLVTLIENVELLAPALAGCASGGSVPASIRSPIEVELRAYIAECIGPSTPLATREGSIA